MNQNNHHNSKGYQIEADKVGHIGDIYYSDKIQQNLLNLNDMRPSLDYWVGRTKEIESIREWLADDKICLIGIAGLGGCGKSTLAVKIYEDESSDFENKFWVDVSRRRITFTELAQRILLQLEIPGKDLEDILESDFVDKLVNHLRETKYLLIIDNLESLLKENGQWLDDNYQKFFKAWFDYGGTSKILVTTRERPKLSEIKTKWLHLSGLQATEGVSLLKSLEIIGNDAQLEELVEKAYGYPLILKFIAGFLREEEELHPEISYLQKYNLANVSQLLTDDKLKGDHRGIETVMRQVFDASFNRLSTKLQRLLLNVSVYRIPFNIVAASAQLPDEELTEQELRQIVRRSLLQEKRDEDGEKRFKFHPLILGYIKTKSDDLTKAHQIALKYYYKSKEKEPEPLEVFYHHLELKQYEKARQILYYLHESLHNFGQNSLRVELYEELLQKWQPVSQENNSEIAWALTYLGLAYDSLKEYEKAIDCHNDSLEIFKEIKEQTGEASALTHLAQVYNSLGESQRAIEYFRETLKSFQDIGERRHEAVVLSSLGSAYKSLKEYQKAINYYEQSLAVFREIGDRTGEANSLNNLGNVYASLDKYQKAIDYYQQSLTIEREIGDKPLGHARSDRSGEATSLNNLAGTYNSLKQYQKAIYYYQQSLTIRREIGNRNGEAASLYNLGCTYDSLKQYQKAIDYYEQSLTIEREIGVCNVEAASLNNLGLAYASLKEYKLAIDNYQQSLNIKREIGDKPLGHARSDRSDEAGYLNNLGLAYTSLKQYQKAIDNHEQSLTIKREIGDKLSEAKTLQLLAQLYHLIGNPKKACITNFQAQQILQETQTPIEEWIIPKWLKSVIKFAQGGKGKLILCFILGVIAFPFALVWILGLMLWRVIRAQFSPI